MTIDLHNWDAVSAITFREVNAAIVAQGASPASLEQTATSSDGTDGYISVTCDPWQLVPAGSSGEDIQVLVPITGGHVIAGDDPDGTQVPITLPSGQSNIPLNVLVQCGFSPSPSDSNQQVLTVQMSVSVPQLSSSDLPGMGLIERAVLNEGLQQWFTNNIQQFNHVFAVADFDASFDSQPQFAWLQPWYVGYAAAVPSESPTVDNSVFGVMTLVDRPSSETTRNQLIQQVSMQIDLGVIPEGAIAGFAISVQKFLEKFILPSTPFMFDNIPQDANPLDYFQLSNDNTSITSTQDLTFDNVEISDSDGSSSETVTATVKAGLFSIDVDATQLNINTTGLTFQPSWADKVVMNYSGTNTISLNSDDRSLELTIVTQSTDGSVEATEAGDIASVALVVVGLVASACAVLGGVVSKVATVTNEAADAAEIGEEVVDGADEAATNTAEVTVCGIALGTYETSTLASVASRAALFSRIAVGVGFAAGSVEAYVKILKAKASGKSEDNVAISEFTSQALGNTMTFPNLPTLTTCSAGLADALVFGFNKSSS
jgi:hypothetical protein